MMSIRHLLRLAAALILLFAFCVSSTGAMAYSSSWSKTKFGAVRLLSSVTGTKGLDQVLLGLEVQLPRGWKTYWRSPGDAGLPPEIDWSRSKGVDDARILFPVPHRFDVIGLQTFGYSDHVIYPIVVDLKGGELDIDADLSTMVCSDICVPLNISLKFWVPEVTPGPTDFSRVLNQWKAQVPTDLPGTDLTVSSVSYHADAIEFEVRGDAPLSGLDIFPEAERATFGIPDIKLGEDGLSAEVRLGYNGTLEESVPVTLTLVSGERFAERHIDGASETGVDISMLVWMALIALVGGMVLNLMPCVLPVLSMKLLAVAHYSGAERGDVRKGFLVSSAGIVASFLLLAVGAIALKSAGMAVGWGMQFQQPVFLAAMGLVLVAFAVNLAGGFEIPMPRFAARLAEGGPTSGLGGHFATGMLATLLATPCSAPFVGTAIGFALSQGSVEILSIFVAMGLGLSVPYLLISAFPSMVSAMPRPGAWTRWVKAFMAAAMLGTAIWLLTVIIAQLGTSVTPSDAHWKKLEQQEISKALDEGKIVIVDITADWCITCKVNKSLVFERAPISEILAREDVVALRGDWTNPNPEISSYLKSHGKYGIPFNVVYGPTAPDGILLPEILTNEAVLNAVDGARER